MFSSPCSALEMKRSTCPELEVKHFGPGSGSIFGKSFPKCGISTRKTVGPKRGPRGRARTRPEARFDPAGSTGRPCRTGAGAPAGAPKGGEKVPKTRAPAAAQRPPDGGRECAWSTAAGGGRRRRGGARSSPGASRGDRGGPQPDSAAGASARLRGRRDRVGGRAARLRLRRVTEGHREWGRAYAAGTPQPGADRVRRRSLERTGVAWRVTADPRGRSRAGEAPREARRSVRPAPCGTAPGSRAGTATSATARRHRGSAAGMTRAPGAPRSPRPPLAARPGVRRVESNWRVRSRAFKGPRERRD
jgi:hypothetical protein